MNELTNWKFELIVTSYGQDKNLDDKKQSRKNSGSDSKRRNLKNKTYTLADTLSFVLRLLLLFTSPGLINDLIETS